MTTECNHNDVAETINSTNGDVKQLQNKLFAMISKHMLLLNDLQYNKMHMDIDDDRMGDVIYGIEYLDKQIEYLHDKLDELFDITRRLKIYSLEFSKITTRTFTLTFCSPVV